MLELLLEMKKYIENMEVTVEGERESGRTLEMLLKQSDMPKLYYNVLGSLNGFKDEEIASVEPPECENEEDTPLIRSKRDMMKRYLAESFTSVKVTSYSYEEKSVSLGDLIGAKQNKITDMLYYQFNNEDRKPCIDVYCENILSYREFNFGRVWTETKLGGD